MSKYPKRPQKVSDLNFVKDCWDEFDCRQLLFYLPDMEQGYSRRILAKRLEQIRQTLGVYHDHGEDQLCHGLRGGLFLLLSTEPFSNWEGIVSDHESLDCPLDAAEDAAMRQIESFVPRASVFRVGSEWSDECYDTSIGVHFDYRTFEEDLNPRPFGKVKTKKQ